MKYFTNIKTLEDLKKAYKKLVFELHPDHNKEEGAAKAFIEMKAEYDLLFEKVKNKRINSQGEYYETETEETLEEFKDIIERVVFFEGCKIEIIGTWIWISGNTFKYKDQLKELKFRWSKNKNAWSFHNGEYRKKSKTKFSLEELREKFGNQDINNKQMAILEA